MGPPIWSFLVCLSLVLWLVTLRCNVGETICRFGSPIPVSLHPASPSLMMMRRRKRFSWNLSTFFAYCRFLTIHRVPIYLPSASSMENGFLGYVKWYRELFFSLIRIFIQKSLKFFIFELFWLSWLCSAGTILEKFLFKEHYCRKLP